MDSSPVHLVCLLMVFVLVGLAALWHRVECVRDELRRDASGALSPRAARLAYTEMERGAIVLVEIEGAGCPELAADRLLAQARRAIAAELRETDICGRHGSGFVLLLPGASPQDALRKAVDVERRLLSMRPRGARCRTGIGHTEQDDPWTAAAEQLRAGRPQDRRPPSPPAACVPLRLAAEIAGPHRSTRPAAAVA